MKTDKFLNDLIVSNFFMSGYLEEEMDEMVVAG